MRRHYSNGKGSLLLLDLSLALTEVSRNASCSGCGTCALAIPCVEMCLDRETGFLRPGLRPGRGDPEGDPVKMLSKVCPGYGSTAPLDERPFDAHFGPYLSTWRAWAVDPAIRHAGSSGGVITALLQWLLRTGRYGAVAGVRGGGHDPASSEGVLLRSPEEAIDAAGSRYYPVSSIASLDLSEPCAVVAKPCEIAGLRKVEGQSSMPPHLAISLFCAGTPSSHSTGRVLRDLGVHPESLAHLRYRGHGWPGRFSATRRDGTEESMSYSDAWSSFLGRDLDGLCRICVDGTGMQADLSIGDLWTTDASGYPLFEEGAGVSAVIARTAAGEELLSQAIDAGVVRAERIQIGDVTSVQPVQVRRANSLLARLASRRLMGLRTPRYRGYGLTALAFQHPASSARFFVGTLKRLLRERREQEGVR